MFSAVVYTAGRTGSHALIEILQKHFKVPKRTDYDVNFNYGIVHTHNPLYEPPNNDFIAIVNQRRDLFSAILSMELTKVHGEFSFYTNKHIDNCVIDPKDFKNCYFFQKAFYKSINLTKFNQVINIFYEDMLVGNIIKKEFGVDANFDNIQHRKSPYNYYKIVSNVEELKLIFDDLEQNEITNEQLSQFKQSVVDDLKDIRINYQDNRK